MLPTDGWIYEGQNDLKAASGSCQLCGTTIRFEHYVFHKEVGVLIIGCECAKKIMDGEDLENVKKHDKDMKDMARREKAEMDRLQRNWKARNEFNEKRGIPLVGWEDYLKQVEEMTKINAEIARRKEAKKNGRCKKVQHRF